MMFCKIAIKTVEPALTGTAGQKHATSLTSARVCQLGTSKNSVVPAKAGIQVL